MWWKSTEILETEDFNIKVSKKEFKAKSIPLLCCLWYHRYLPKFLWKKILRLKEPQPFKYTIETIYVPLERV